MNSPDDAVIVSLEAWAMDHDQRVLKGDAETEVEKLDNQLERLCLSMDHSGPSVTWFRAGHRPYGFCQMPFARSAMGMTVYATPEWRQALRRLRTELQTLRARVDTSRQDRVETEEVDPLPSLLSAAELAKRIGQPVARVESFLRRYRAKHPDCFIESSCSRRNEPRYLFRTADVWPALLQMGSTARPQPATSMQSEEPSS